MCWRRFVCSSFSPVSVVQCERPGDGQIASSGSEFLRIRALLPPQLSRRRKPPGTITAAVQSDSCEMHRTAQPGGRPKDQVCELLNAWSAGDMSALERLTPIVYDELHRLARRYMRGERPGHSLQTTALVNEAYMRLVDYT